ncbi:hypothetical protein GS415_03935 [Rhodococcus hoagii]|nr:hypothetical protein [Prescottella equi]
MLQSPVMDPFKKINAKFVDDLDRLESSPPSHTQGSIKAHVSQSVAIDRRASGRNTRSTPIRMADLRLFVKALEDLPDASEITVLTDYIGWMVDGNEELAPTDLQADANDNNITMSVR